MALNDAEAADELAQDNMRRAHELIDKGMPPGAWNEAVGAIRQDAFINAVLYHLGGSDAVDSLNLQIAGTVSHWLDDAEKAIETLSKDRAQAVARERLVIANGKVPRA